MSYFLSFAIISLTLLGCNPNISPYTISTLDTYAVKAPVLENPAVGFGLGQEGMICDGDKCYPDPNFKPNSTGSEKIVDTPAEQPKAGNNTQPSTPSTTTPGFEIDMSASKWATGDGSQYLRPLKGNTNVYAYFDKNDKQLPWLYDKNSGLLSSYKESPSEIYADNKFNLAKATDIYRVESKGDGNYYGQQLSYKPQPGQMETSPTSDPLVATGLNYYYGNMQTVKSGETTLVAQPGWGFLYQATPVALEKTPFASQLKLGAEIKEPVFFNPLQPNSYLQANQVNLEQMWVKKQPVAQPQVAQQQNLGQQRPVQASQPRSSQQQASNVEYYYVSDGSFTCGPCDRFKSDHADKIASGQYVLIPVDRTTAGQVGGVPRRAR